MLGFSASNAASGEQLSEVDLEGVSPKNAVLLAQWLEGSGGTGISKSELWVQKSANIWLAMSLKS